MILNDSPSEFHMKKIFAVNGNYLLYYLCTIRWYNMK